MGLNYVKTAVGWTIVLGHLVLGILVVFVQRGKLEPDQMLGVLLVIAPVFSIYFVAVVRSFIESGAERGPGDLRNANFAAISILLPLVEFIFAGYLVLTYPNGLAGTVEMLQKWLSGMEVFLGGSLGLVVENLFPKATQK